MNKVKINNLELSELCFGGGKLVDMDIEEGRKLVQEAIKLGINVVDGHHRYGNAERIFGLFDDIETVTIEYPLVKMTKVSAYKLNENYKTLVLKSIKAMKQIDIMWVSDLDDITLYDNGVKIYEWLTDGLFDLVGITTENPQLAFKFMNEHPECRLFMMPVYKGIEPAWTMDFIEKAREHGKFTFAIKPFLDGQLLGKYTVKECLQTVKKSGVDVILFGTSNIEHLRETVRIYEGISNESK